MVGSSEAAPAYARGRLRSRPIRTRSAMAPAVEQIDQDERCTVVSERSSADAAPSLLLSRPSDAR